jgi:hypothetical protein
MTPINKLMPFVLTLVIGVLLQAGFVMLDCKEAPYKIAMDFTRAYFSLDPAMANHLCKGEDPAGQATMVSSFIERSKTDMVKRGLSPAMTKSGLYHVKTYTVQKSDREAEVQLTACRKTAINPVFYFTAKLFDLGKTTPVKETIKMMKEDGRWKICGPVFDLAVDKS